MNIDHEDQVISEIPKKNSSLHDNVKMSLNHHQRKKSSPMGLLSQRRMELKSVSSLSEIQ